MPTPTTPASDRALTLRMAAATLALAAVYVVLIALLLAVGAGPVAAAVVAVALCLAQYFSCDRVARAAAGARSIGEDEAPELHDALRRACVRAEQPLPRLALIQTASPNAFTVGRTPSTATVCVTAGLAAQLSEPELEAVLAHELAHIAHRDVMVMTIAGFFASLGAAIVRASTRWRRPPDRDRRPAAVVVIVADLLYLLSWTCVRALSRERELVADRDAAIRTGDPGALAAALVRLSGDARSPAAPDTPLPGELAPFEIVAVDVAVTVATLFATHPPLAERLAQLDRLQLALPAAAVA